MNETPPSSVSPSAGNNGGSRNGSRGVVAGAFDLSRSVVYALPPAFLLLILINAIFIGSLLWFLESQSKQRNTILEKLVDRCMDIALHENPGQDGH